MERALDNAALAGHYDFALPVMSPTRRQREVVTGHVASFPDGGHGDGGDFRAQCAFGDAPHGRIGIEQGGEFAAPRRRAGERLRSAFGLAVGPTGKRNARPAHAESSGIGLAVGGVVQHGKDMVEQVLYAQPQAVEIVLRRTRQVGFARRAEAVVAQPRREETGQPVAEIIRKVMNYGSA